MKYSTQITLNLPRQKVVELFDNEENMYKWMKGLQSHKHLSGQPGQEGAKMEMHFKMGKREMTMVETILKNNLPDQFTTAYEAKGVYNIVDNLFKEIDENTTEYTTVHEFQFKGFMKIMGWLMPGAFKKQSKKYMADFKAFAEGAH